MCARQANHEGPAPLFRIIGIFGISSENSVQEEERPCITGMNPKQDSFLFPCGSCLYLGAFLPMPISKEPFRLREQSLLWRVLRVPLA